MGADFSADGRTDIRRSCYSLLAVLRTRPQKCVQCHAQEEPGVVDKNTSAIAITHVLCTHGLFGSHAYVIAQRIYIALRCVYCGQYSDVG